MRRDCVGHLARGVDVEIGVVRHHAPEEGDVDRVLRFEDLLDFFLLQLLARASALHGQFGQLRYLHVGKEQKITRFLRLL